jgi:hypothetical protein
MLIFVTWRVAIGDIQAFMLKYAMNKLCQRGCNPITLLKSQY